MLDIWVLLQCLLLLCLSYCSEYSRASLLSLSAHGERAVDHSHQGNALTFPCPHRHYRKSGTCIPCTNCHSQGLDILSPCSQSQDEICRIPPVYGLTQIYKSSKRATPGPTHRVRQKVLSSGYVRDGSIEKLRNAFFFRGTEEESSDLENGRIKYEEDDSAKKDSLHSDLEVIEKELLREKAVENEFKLMMESTTTTKVPRRKYSKELRRRRKKKNKSSTRKGSTTTSTTTTMTTTPTTTPPPTTTTTASTTTTSKTTTTTNYHQVFREQVFGQIVEESHSDSQIRNIHPLEDLVTQEEVQKHSSLGRKHSSEGLRKAYSVQTFKILDNRAGSSVNNNNSGANANSHSIYGPPSMDTYVQSLVSSRTSSFHRSTESRLTSTSTIPISPNNSSPSSPNNRPSGTPPVGSSPRASLTYVDSNGRTNIRKGVMSLSHQGSTLARELPV
ncbi:unnamed protein product [Lepeophtheirus salmonis]|uniref:(salmon louse) hypothetical protein n=1 Tax=Lepeophtheirus salmonis TaxID=72036 RepID=A0A7R8HB31_LEPSM|nr:unnamed protein product [Lepeophtheirus salmonis]CAF2985408.1 unnamed protein product [Lepeophtheirus salmonis]